MLKRELLNPKVNEVLDAVLSFKDDIPEELIVMLTNYAFGEMSSSLRATMVLYDQTKKPLNNYVYILGESSIGKDRSLSALNTIFVNSFKESMEKGFYKHREKYLEKKAMQLVDQDVEDVDEIMEEEAKSLVRFSYRMSSATEKGVGKLRMTYDKLNIGACNLVIDELGANYNALRSILALMLSTYEDGNSESRILNEDGLDAVYGVPSNMLAYSSPALLLDGGLTEKAFFDDLNQGQGRRAFFALVTKPKPVKMTGAQRVKMARDKVDANKKSHTELDDYFKSLAKPKYMYKEMVLTEEADVALADYHIECEDLVEKSKTMPEMERIELLNRAWKATRLAGIYAFISKAESITKEFADQAIYIAKISGDAFSKICNQPLPHQRLFEFISKREKTTDADLASNAWFKGNVSYRKDMLSLSRAYAYEQDNLFKIKEVEGVSFYSFVPMPKTDIDNIRISISKDLTKGYKSKKVPFDIIHEVMGNPDFCYSMTQFKNGHRNKANAIKGQVLLPFDIDDGLKLKTAQAMFSNYKCMTITTKSHQKDKNGLTVDRFRLVFIIDRKLDLSPDDYAKFIKNAADRLGIGSIIDQAATDVSRGFFGAKGEHWYSAGDKLFEVAEMIPETEKERERSSMLSGSGVGGADGMERFLLEEAMVGSRNNVILKWSLFLKDEGYDYRSAKDKVLDFNSKLPEQ